MIRARFYIGKDDCDNDYRPVKWPIKYPYWCSAESSNSFVLVAYAEDEDSIKELWPEAYDINVLEKDTEIRFTLRFPKPEWYELYERELEECDRFIWITDACMRDGVSWVLKPMVENVPSGWNSLGCGGRKMYINIEGKGIVTSNNCWCQGDVSDAFKDLMPDNATWATKEEFDKAPVVGHIIEGIGLVFTDRGGHEVNA